MRLSADQVWTPEALRLLDGGVVVRDSGEITRVIIARTIALLQTGATYDVRTVILPHLHTALNGGNHDISPLIHRVGQQIHTALVRGNIAGLFTAVRGVIDEILTPPVVEITERVLVETVTGASGDVGEASDTPVPQPLPEKRLIQDVIVPKDLRDATDIANAFRCLRQSVDFDTLREEEIWTLSTGEIKTRLQKCRCSGSSNWYTILFRILRFRSRKNIEGSTIKEKPLRDILYDEIFFLVPNGPYVRQPRTSGAKRAVVIGNDIETAEDTGTTERLVDTGIASPGKLVYAKYDPEVPPVLPANFTCRAPDAIKWKIYGDFYGVDVRTWKSNGKKISRAEICRQRGITNSLLAAHLTQARREIEDFGKPRKKYTRRAGAGGVIFPGLVEEKIHIPPSGATGPTVSAKVFDRATIPALPPDHTLTVDELRVHGAYYGNAEAPLLVAQKLGMTIMAMMMHVKSIGVKLGTIVVPPVSITPANTGKPDGLMKGDGGGDGGLAAGRASILPEDDGDALRSALRKMENAGAPASSGRARGPGSRGPYKKNKLNGTVTTDSNNEAPTVPAGKKAAGAAAHIDAIAATLEREGELSTKELVRAAREQRGSGGGATDPMNLFMREVMKTPLLTPEEEIELAGRIKKGSKLARDHMIKANLRLVVKIAHDYKYYGLPLLDLVQEGSIGLTKAVERFDPNKGGKVSTYAAWWIKQSIKRALANQGKTIRLPVHVIEKISKMRRIALTMSEELGREPTDDELSEATGIDRESLAELRTASMRPASLDAPISADDSTEFGERLGDEGALQAGEVLEHKDELDQLDGLLGVLDERELKIIQMRFGLHPYKREYTLEEVGAEHGVTRERIRQLQNIALKKMRRAKAQKEDPQSPRNKALKKKNKKQSPGLLALAHSSRDGDFFGEDEKDEFLD